MFVYLCNFFVFLVHNRERELGAPCEEEEEKEYDTKKVLKKTLKRKAYTQVKAEKQTR